MLVVEDGTGVPAAESYTSLAEAAAYFAAFPHDDWQGSDSEKEGALRLASRDIDLLFGQEFVGEPLASEQGLQFPRVGDTTVRLSLKRATMELAALILGGFEPTGSPDGNSSATELSFKVEGVYSETVKYGEGRSTDAPELYRIRLMLAPLLAVQPSSSSFTLASVVRG